MVELITPKIFFDVVRGKASLDDTNRVYEALSAPESDLNRWLGAVERYAEKVFQAQGEALSPPLRQDQKRGRGR